jgi:hypothetical protein
MIRVWIVPGSDSLPEEEARLRWESIGYDPIIAKVNNRDEIGFLEAKLI